MNIESSPMLVRIRWKSVVSGKSNAVITGDCAGATSCTLWGPLSDHVSWRSALENCVTRSLYLDSAFLFFFSQPPPSAPLPGVPLVRKSSVLRAASALGIINEKPQPIVYTPRRAWMSQATTVSLASSVSSSFSSSSLLLSSSLSLSLSSSSFCNTYIDKWINKFSTFLCTV